MACKVERFQSIGKGRGLRATSPASPGEVLYVAEPFAYTVRISGRRKVCEFCLTTKDHLLHCSQCKFAKYCSKQCQVAAWPNHKEECKCLESAKSIFNTDLIRLGGKMVFKILRKTHCPSENLCSMFELESNLEKQSREFKENNALQADMLRLYMKKEIPADINLIELFAKEVTNCFTIVNGKTEPAAVGLYPSMSLLNHSCEPNCSIYFMGPYLHLRAIRKIQASEELTITYINPLMPSEERQSELRCNYNFACDCHRCQTHDKDEKMLAGDKQASDETKELVKKVQVLQSNDQWEESLTLCRAQLQRNTGRVPDENIYQLAILNHAMKACMCLNLPEEGLHYGNRSLEPYRMYTTGINSVCAELMFHIGTMLISQGKMDEAVNILLEVYEVLKVFNGRDDPMTQTVISFLHEFHA